LASYVSFTVHFDQDGLPKNEGNPSLKHVLAHGRSDPKAYTWFVTNLLVCVLPRKRLSNLKTQSPSQVFTTSDEALILWQWENSEEVWKDMIRTGNTKNSTVAAKFTVAGNKGSTNKFSGWSEDGKRRYNTIFTWVEKDRLENGNTFDSYYKEYVSQSTRGKKTKSNTTTALLEKEAPVEMRNGLGFLLNQTSSSSATSTSTVSAPGLPPPNNAPTPMHQELSKSEREFATTLKQQHPFVVTQSFQA